MSVYSEDRKNANNKCFKILAYILIRYVGLMMNHYVLC
jgi:hypothetical protein